MFPAAYALKVPLGETIKQQLLYLSSISERLELHRADSQV